jgi:hypothetical protein
MATGFFTNDWITQKAKILYRGATPPSSTKFRLALANTATLTRASSLADFIANELLPTNGYARALIDFGGDGIYDTTDQRHEMPVPSIGFTASGGSLQWQTVFLIADSVAVASKSFTNANVNPTTDRITITAHGFANGDKKMFTADSLAFLPGNLTTGTVYQVASATINDFQLQPSDGGSTVNITDTGSGTFRIRSADGIIVCFAVESSPITLTDGQGYSYRLPIIEANVGYANGA